MQEERPIWGGQDNLKINCKICISDYTDSNLPMILRCGHTICARCSSTVLVCPFCREEGLDPRINYSLLELSNRGGQPTLPTPREPCTRLECIQNRRKIYLHEHDDLLVECVTCRRQMYIGERIFLHSNIKEYFNLVDFEPCKSGAHMYSNAWGFDVALMAPQAHVTAFCKKCFTCLRDVLRSNTTHPDMKLLEGV